MDNIISKAERDAMRHFLDSPEYRAYSHIMELVISKIQDDSDVRDTEWDTLKCVLLKQGKVEGIKRLHDEIYNQAKQ